MNTEPDNSITAYLPSEDMLKKISFKSSYGKSLNKLHLTDSLLNIVITDSGKFYNDLIREDCMFNYIWRIKSKESIVRKYDKFHYQIEIQLWSDKDYHFNLWSHELTYKTVSDSLLARMRMLYDNGTIKSKSDFMEVLHAEQISKR